jgi:hypothetical protein
MLAHAYNPKSLEAEAGESWVQGQPGPNSEAPEKRPPQKMKNTA